MESIGSSPITLVTILALLRSAEIYPRPRSKVISIDNFAPSLSVAMCMSGFKISTSLSQLIEPAVTLHGPSAEISTVFGPSQCKLAISL